MLQFYSLEIALASAKPLLWLIMKYTAVRNFTSFLNSLTVLDSNLQSVNVLKQTFQNTIPKSECFIFRRFYIILIKSTVSCIFAMHSLFSASTIFFFFTNNVEENWVIFSKDKLI